jgi:hypothetical protein
MHRLDQALLASVGVALLAVAHGEHQDAGCGWSSEQLTEAFGYLALTVFAAYFATYAQTPIDLPAEPAPAAAAGVAGSGAAAGERG